VSSPSPSSSCCTLEFEARRESYYWLLHELELYKPNVWEFSRLQLEYTVMSKRRLLKLVEQKYVSGWDDPRLSTLNGFRRRGVPATAIKLFCDTIGVTRNENFIALALLEFCCRQSLEPLATRGMIVVDPIKIILTNYPAGKSELLPALNFPKNPELGTHDILLTRTVYISRDDFSEVDAGKDFFGLSVGKEIHLKHAYNIRADKLIYEADGKTLKEVHATIDLTNKSKPKGKITWVADLAENVPPMEVELRLYDTLFLSKDPQSVEDWISDLNPNSLVVKKAYADPSLKNAKAGQSRTHTHTSYTHIHSPPLTHPHGNRIWLTVDHPPWPTSFSSLSFHLA
jgi:glutaminyl-tRNA synthetase